MDAVLDAQACPDGVADTDMVENSLSGGPAADPAAETMDPAAPRVSPESIVEAVLMATDDPLSAGSIAEVVGMTPAEVKRHIEALNARYESNGTSFRITGIAKGFQILTLPAFDSWIQKFNKKRADSRLSAAALETLAIVAYKQPIIRVDIEAIRGVAVGDMLVRLRDANLVRIVGRAEEVGRPLLYGTTTRFLEVFGLASLKDLPKIEDDKPIPPLKIVNPE